MMLLPATNLVLVASTPAARQTELPPNYGTQLLQTLLIFLVGVGVMYLVALAAIRWFKPRHRTSEAGGVPAIEILASRPLALGKTIYHIRFRGREWLVAATPHSCQTLAEVTPEPFRPASPPVSPKPPSTASPVQAPPAGERV